MTRLTLIVMLPDGRKLIGTYPAAEAISRRFVAIAEGAQAELRDPSPHYLRRKFA